MSASNPLRRARDSAVRSALIWRCSASETGESLRPHRPPWASRRVVRAITMIWSGRLGRPPSTAHRSPPSAYRPQRPVHRPPPTEAARQTFIGGRTQSTPLSGGVRARERPCSFLQPETLTSPISSSGWPLRPIWASRRMPTCSVMPAATSWPTMASTRARSRPTSGINAIEAASYNAGQHSIHATVSVGVASCNEATADLAGLLKVADQALYRAKTAGRNRVETSSLAAESAPLRRPDDLSIHKRFAA
jgi:Diguanylate cyclase, GGDEF domain